MQVHEPTEELKPINKDFVSKKEMATDDGECCANWSNGNNLANMLEGRRFDAYATDDSDFLSN